MDEPMTLLFGLDEFVVVDVSRVEGATVRVVIETLAREGACPECGTLSARVKDRPLRRIKDLRASGQRVVLWWRKRRLVCLPATCPRRSFLERTVAIPPRSRLTTRLREHLAQAIAGSNRAVSEVAAEHRVAWHAAHRALVAAAARWLPAPTPTAVLGIDETRARSVRWLREATGWKRSDPWLTSFVDADPTRRGLLLGLAPGRSGGFVKSWLAEQTPEFRAGVNTVVIDPSAPCASGIRAALPHARIAVDHFHLVRLANEMVTDVRQRVAREQLGRRGTTADPVWVHRRMLLAAGDRLSPRQLRRLERVLAGDDPTNEIGAAWGVKELLRQLLAARDPADIRAPALGVLLRLRRRRHDRDHLARDDDRDVVAARPGVPAARRNQRQHGGLQQDHQAGQAHIGFRNMDNYQRRIMSHIPITRTATQAA
jgi:transposase